MIGSPRDTKEYVDFVDWYNAFTSSLMEPLLRLGYSARLIQRKVDGNGILKEVMDIETDAGTITDAMLDAEVGFYKHLSGMSKSAERTDAIVKATVDGFTEQRVADKDAIAALKRRVAELEWRLKQRHGVHDPKSPEVRATVLKLNDGKCVYCNAQVSDVKGDGLADLEVDHLVPKSRGGPDHISNFLPSCSCCNGQKHAGHVIEFIRRRVGGA